MAVKREKLSKVAQHLEEEARMVLPGIQALFGFQLIAVFNQRFAELVAQDQLFHFIALLCTAVSMLLVLTPAAFHRQAEPTEISTFFCNMGSFLLTLSLYPLAIGICLDLFIIAHVILGDRALSVKIAGVMLFCFVMAWFIFPQYHKRKHGPLY